MTNLSLCPSCCHTILLLPYAPCKISSSGLNQPPAYPELDGSSIVASSAFVVARVTKFHYLFHLYWLVEMSEMSLEMLTLDIGIFSFIPLLVLPGILRATFRCINFVLASDGVNLAAIIVTRTVSIGARMRRLTAFTTFSSLTKLVRGMVEERCYMSSNKIHEVN